MEHAGMMELVDVTDSKSVELITRVGSSPTTGTIRKSRTPGSVRGFGTFLDLCILRFVGILEMKKTEIHQSAVSLFFSSGMPVCIHH